MDRIALVPARYRAERLALLDALAGNDAPFDCDPDAFLAIAPRKLHPFLYLRLRERAGGALLETLQAAYRRAALQELQRAAQLRRIRDALQGAGIRFLVLKGPVLAATVYPDRASRTMMDLDLLVDPEHRDRAIAILGDTGFHMPREFVGGRIEAGDAPPLVDGAPGGASIDLHTMLDSLPDERRALDVLWPTAQPVDAGHGLVLQAPGRAELFAHVVLHVSKHHRFDRELRSLLDVALLLRREPLDWDALLAEWDRRDIAKWIVLTARLAHILLGAPLPDALAARSTPDEALEIAAGQLWGPEKPDLPRRVTYAIGGGAPEPVHAHVEATTVPVPHGVEGVKARAVRFASHVRRAVAAAARPGEIASEAHLHRQRERLFSIVEKGSER